MHTSTPPQRTPLDPALAELADAYGVVTTFGDWRGGPAKASADAVIAVLGALGVDATGPDAVAAALRDARDAPWRRMLPPYVVVRAGTRGRVAVHVPHGEPALAEIFLEGGGGAEVRQLMVWVDPREVDGELVGEATFEIADDVPPGYHELRATSGQRQESALLLVVPDRLALPAARVWGFMLQLYAVRSRRSWGMGDLGDLGDLAAASARELGAGFALVNPLHAAQPLAPMEPSPYFPSSRRFVNPLYLRVEDVAAVALLPAAAARAAAGLQARNDVDEPLDRDAVWSAKRQVLAQAFERRKDPALGAEFAEFSLFVEREGRPLADFATWCALAETFGLPWREWPAQLQDPRSEAVAEFRARHGDLVEFHAWLQWLCGQQLDAVQGAARAAGMPIGIVHDLAVGVSPAGADAWALQDVLAPGITLGAPADMYNQQGQRWNLPAWHPHRLAAARFDPYRGMIRAGLRHGGGLRVDHVIGLFRQWWVRDGAAPADGAYLRLDHEAMLGIVLLEADRAGAVIVGEDLGVVEPWARDHLRERGVIGTSVLWFERGSDGQPLPAPQWRRACLATVTTHDLPPSAGYLTGAHVELRAKLGLLERDADEENAHDEAERLDWLRALVGAGSLEPSILADIENRAHEPFAQRVEPHIPAVLAALHRYLLATPSRLVGVYLPDVVGDRRPVNQPGTIDEYPNWRVPMAGADGRPALLDDVIAGFRLPAPGWLGLLADAAGASVSVSSSDDRSP